MGDYYDHDGQPIDLMTWAALVEDIENKILVQTHFIDEFMVSTVWLGLDHNFWPTGPPLIYETMVFGPNAVESTVFPGRMYREDYFIQRYSTKEQAQVGHWEMVALVTIEHGEPIQHTTSAWAISS